MSIISGVKSKVMGYVLTGAIIVVGTPVYLGGKHVMAEQAGTACQAETHCRGQGILSSGMCLEAEGSPAYCSHDCSVSADCPTGLACEAVEGTFTSTTTQGNHASKSSSSQGTKHLCVKPTPRATHP